MPYIPHTPNDTKEMLTAVGAQDIQDLFDEIPASLQYAGFQSIPAGINEMEMLKEAQNQAQKNRNGICFIGAGCYEHHIPAAVWDIASRGEFLTAYTPYQAEASQGTLQLLYEYQTMICELTGMEVSNASMYDGATALAEAVLMAVRLNKHSKTNRVLITGTVHPFYRETIETIVRNQHIEVITLPFDEQQGITDFGSLNQYTGEDITALVIAQPNFFGCLEQVDKMTSWAHHNKTISVACVNPTSLALLKPPCSWGEHGVEIVCGEGQPLGSPMASGGPYFGFLSTRMAHVRQMPGRIIGRTVDKDGKTGFSLTLQAREQHIRRAKATSNICTNQGLLVTAATIYMSLLGPEGLSQVATQCHQNTHELITALTQIEGVELAFKAPFFHEALIKLNQPVQSVLQQLADAGIAGGYAPEQHYPQLANTLLVCATEVRSAEDIAKYAKTLKTIMSKRGA
ncbi:TPA: aminomethyl-transferring glycine dehydrogenase subunit GcvPA [Legionella pneumophila]|uniref:Probable glycine dehydrogenase (decarboxylating) subunit 1 n=3 Tax=Legionella pneumophila TaxID=446 RepID=GCSPA_LEGPA|nr:aminomethyl-transferring glycine dehydrogenase subunit GcvPA [Legionella pneumophila]Q5X8W3.1 RecName: Full=Probable glycine dehydrogenase (decarboxylating) subunit 1; AltName: Full=Glycine cleavage system P-protein subunit 1; AltName: Full=Glycine decarboxylase subunit 1; AltName: Full=Glycine dehydrogenase (aminomethyl-transferring) subunit 1 [Legionella pneumophila str. Paris]ERH43602.1 glycine dehydrogenase subunit 1 [Legionella pneumophila str. Leg01/53]ERH43675.1 glycine dehydrogenase s